MNKSEFGWRPDKKTKLKNCIASFITVNPDDFLKIFNLENLSVVRMTGLRFHFRKLSAILLAKHQAAYVITTILFGSIDYLDLGVVFDRQ
jgi:hypothetical protein